MGGESVEWSPSLLEEAGKTIQELGALLAERDARIAGLEAEAKGHAEAYLRETYAHAATIAARDRLAAEVGTLRDALGALLKACDEDVGALATADAVIAARAALRAGQIPEVPRG